MKFIVRISNTSNTLFFNKLVFKYTVYMVQYPWLGRCLPPGRCRSQLFISKIITLKVFSSSFSDSTILNVYPNLKAVILKLFRNKCSFRRAWMHNSIPVLAKIFFHYIQGLKLICFNPFKGYFITSKKSVCILFWGLPAKSKASAGHIWPANRNCECLFQRISIKTGHSNKAVRYRLNS